MRTTYIPQYSLNDKEAAVLKKFAATIKPLADKHDLLPNFLEMVATSKQYNKSVKDAILVSLRELLDSLPELEEDEEAGKILLDLEKVVDILMLESPGEQFGAERMRQVGLKTAAELPGLGYALFVFELDKPGISNYISNANRDDMVLALKETLKRFEEKQDFDTPHEN